MKQIIVIGTLHAGLTPKKEIIKILEDYQPKQILIEISQEDINENNINSYPPEMLAVYNWAKDNGIKVNGIDSKINELKEGLTEENNKKAIEEQKKLMKNFTWKDMNKEENLKILQIKSADELIDKNKERQREKEMLKNIKKSLVKEGTILVITGCGHLDFLEKNLKEAVFPFR